VVTGLLFSLLFFPLVGLAVTPRNPVVGGLGAAGMALFVAAVWHVPLVWVIVALTIGALPFVRRLRLHPALLVFVPILIVAAILPLQDYDGRTFWMLKAKAIAHEGAIDGPFFRGETSYNPRNEYPLLVPLDAAAILTVARDLDDRHVRWLFVLFALGFALELYRRCGPWFAAIFLVLPQILIEPDGGVFSAYADIALGAFVACAFFELTDDKGSPLRLGLFASFALLTKNEGLPLALLLLALGAFIFRKRIAIALAPFAIAFAHLVIWRARIEQFDEPDYASMIFDLPQHLDRFAGAFAELASNIFALHDWSIFLIAAVLSAVLRPKPIALAIIAPMMLLYAAVYAVTPWELSGMGENIAPRLFTHVLGPLFYLLAFIAPTQSKATGGLRRAGATGGA
jgi:hypothetical protein